MFCMANIQRWTSVICYPDRRILAIQEALPAAGTASCPAQRHVADHAPNFSWWPGPEDDAHQQSSLLLPPPRAELLSGAVMPRVKLLPRGEVLGDLGPGLSRIACVCCARPVLAAVPRMLANA